jgi:hypothetical protein
VEKGFFFNGIDMFGNNFAIYKAVKGPASVFPYTANAPFAFLDLAPMVAQIAAHPVFSHCFIKHCFLHNLSPDP